MTIENILTIISGLILLVIFIYIIESKRPKTKNEIIKAMNKAIVKKQNAKNHKQYIRYKNKIDFWQDKFKKAKK